MPQMVFGDVKIGNFVSRTLFYSKATAPITK
jgi:hypothetical protein